MDQLVERAAPRGATPAFGVTALEALAERLADSPSDPWLFWRPGWRWRWRSWEEIADQVMRGAEVIEQAADSAHGTWYRAAFEHRIEPDAIALYLAVEASGLTAYPFAGRRQTGPPDWDVWVDTVSGEEGMGAVGPTDDDRPSDQPSDRPSDRPSNWPSRLRLPGCRSRFDPEPLRRLHALRGRPTARGEHGVEVGPWTSRLSRLLSARRDERAKTEREIICVGPGLDPAIFYGLVTASAIHGTGLMLEGDDEIFPAAVAWARPHGVVASAAALQRAITALGTKRRGRRLRWVVTAPSAGEHGDTAVGETAAPDRLPGEARARLAEWEVRSIEGPSWGSDGA